MVVLVAVDADAAVVIADIVVDIVDLRCRVDRKMVAVFII